MAAWMRRDLSAGCATCRLRFSAALAVCPACGRGSLPAFEASRRIELPATAAWIAKWAIVLAALCGISCAAYIAIVKNDDVAFPPRNAIAVLIFVVGGVLLFAFAAVAVAIPFGVYAGIITLLRWMFGGFVDKPARFLRPTFDHAPRSTSQSLPAKTEISSAPGALPSAVDSSFFKQESGRVLKIAVPLLAIAEIVAEIFGGQPSVHFETLPQALRALAEMLFFNALMIVCAMIPAGIVLAGGAWFWQWVKRPPRLFGFVAAPPVLVETQLMLWQKDRVSITGRAEPLHEDERHALPQSSAERDLLVSPVSGEPCLAFRLQGDAAGAPFDDADLLSFAVMTDEGRRVVIDANDVLIALQTPDEANNLQETAFLSARGLPTTQVSMKHGRLQPSARVRVTGNLRTISAAGGDYRQAGRFEVIDASDGRPVVVESEVVPIVDSAGKLT